MVGVGLDVAVVFVPVLPWPPGIVLPSVLTWLALTVKLPDSSAVEVGVNVTVAPDTEKFPGCGDATMDVI